MVKRLQFYTTTLLLLISLSFISSCEKIEDLINDKDISLWTDKYEVTPFEIVAISSDSYSFREETYSAKIADKEIILKRNEENQLIFMIPSISEGSQTLSLSIEDEEFSLEFSVEALEVINNPEEIIDNYKQRIHHILDTITLMNSIYNAQISESNIQVIEGYLSDFEQAYTTATDIEKLEVAQFMQIHQTLFDFNSFDFQIFNDSLNGKKSFEYWDTKMRREMNYFVSLVIATGATVILFEGALISLNPFLIAITGAALVAEVLLVSQQLEMMLNRCYKPDDFDFADDFKLSRSLEFHTNIEYKLGIDATYRSLYANDQESSELILELVAQINTFSGYWNTVTQHIPGMDGSVTNLNDQDSYITNPNRAAVTPQYITIENISNPNVSLINFSNGNEEVLVTFTTNNPDIQNFTFDIVYGNPDFSTGTTTISASLVTVMDSTEFYQQAVLGNWIVGHISGATDDLDLVLNENGQGLYIGYVGETPFASPYDMNWEIRKIDGRYYLYDSGFWHYAYSGEARDPLGYPLTQFKTYGNYVPGESRIFVRN